MGLRRQISLLIVLLVCSTLASWALLGKGKEKQNSVPPSMSEHQRAVHALNRLAFGPRPGDVERVAAMGVERWIEQQLHPEKIDDSALDARLAQFPTLRMSTREIVENFPPEQVIKAVAEGKQPLPSDRIKRAIYQAQIERFEQKQERKQQAAQVPTSVADKMTVGMAEGDGIDNPENVDSLLNMPAGQRFQAALAMSPEQQRRLMPDLKNRSEQFLDGMTPRQRETVKALANPQPIAISELTESKILRTTYSERQLQEVMTDFWFNHFNVFSGKGIDRDLLTSYERDVIRRHAMGKFEDLLVATAQSPAMLFYLDNWLSVGPNSDFANGISKRGGRMQPGKKPQKKRSGLNENYGRELMELHTLGVNGGYTQKDVTEVARVFTGWTLKKPQEGGGFIFDERMHDPGDKMVLGHRIKARGQKEGMEVLQLLARNPSTARFVCTKLAVRFVSDNPPPALIDRMARIYLKKDGDIREVLKTLFTSPEFWSEDAYRAKVKTPLEFVVSALRASDAEISEAAPIARQLQNMGMPLYGAQPPTGYSMKADPWVNSSALLGRMNFSLALTAGRLKGSEVNPQKLVATDVSQDPEHILTVLENDLLAGDVSQQTHDVISAQLQDPKISGRVLDDPARPPNIAAIAGLLLGSPEFQRR